MWSAADLGVCKPYCCERELLAVVLCKYIYQYDTLGIDIPVVFRSLLAGLASEWKLIALCLNFC
jgi:hypothetical protein